MMGLSLVGAAAGRDGARVVCEGSIAGGDRSYTLKPPPWAHAQAVMGLSIVGAAAGVSGNFRGHRGQQP